MIRRMLGWFRGLAYTPRAAHAGGQHSQGTGPGEHSAEFTRYRPAPQLRWRSRPCLPDIPFPFPTVLAMPAAA